MCSRHATFYQSRIMPYFVHGGCSMPTFARMRERIIPKARGLVAEIGFGSGLNLPYYDPAKVSRLIGIEPDPSMLGIARKRLAECPDADRAHRGPRGGIAVAERKRGHGRRDLRPVHDPRPWARALRNSPYPETGRPPAVHRA